VLSFGLENKGTVESRSNWIRAAVLGANDGIVSMSGLVLGVAGATASASIILTAGVAGIIAATISMAVGEYVSVSSARDLQKALIKKEKKELRDDPKGELQELATMYQDRGLTNETALVVAKELTAKDPIRAHLDIEHRIDEEDLVNPWHAAIASAVAFTAGGLIPMIAITFPPAELRVPVTFIAVLIALTITGTLSAKLGGANVPRAVTRVVVGGALAMIVTNLVGRLFGVRGL
jgi:VIT1/CCC1 family predicted Fe2+/Mn2+ transporter